MSCSIQDMVDFICRIGLLQGVLTVLDGPNVYTVQILIKNIYLFKFLKSIRENHSFFPYRRILLTTLWWVWEKKTTELRVWGARCVTFWCQVISNKCNYVLSLSWTGFFHLRVPESSAVGSAVGRIKAHDLDIGRNAEVEYTIVPGDGGAMFDITTNEHNQEGIIILKRVGYL